MFLWVGSEGCFCLSKNVNPCPKMRVEESKTNIDYTQTPYQKGK